MLADESSTFAGAVLRVLDAAFPFEDRPAGIVVQGQPGENGAEVDVAVAGRAEAAGALLPALVAAIGADARAGVPLGVLDVE